MEYKNYAKFIFIILLVVIGTVCFVIAVSTVGAMLLKIPTTPENSQIRLELIDLMKTMSGGAMAILAGIVTAAIQFVLNKKKEEQQP